MNSHINKSFRDGEKMTEKNFDSTGAMAAAWFGTPGAANAVETVFGKKENDMEQQTQRISISKTMIDEFYKKYNTECNAEAHRKAAASHSGVRYSMAYLRLGQAFHQEFSLEKITSTEAKMFCDMLYEADGDKAKALIAQITDYDN